MTRLAFTTALVLLPVQAAEVDLFPEAVEQVARHLGAEPMRIPFLGLARLAVKMTQPAGVRDFRLAIWQRVDPLDGGALELKGLGPAVVSVKKGRGERVYIYARPGDDWWRMLVVTLDRSNAVVIGMTLRPEEAVRFVDKQRSSASTF